MRLWRLMVLVVYVAVVLAVLVGVMRTDKPALPEVAFFAALVLPIGLIAVSGLILPPGPHRDWLTNLLVMVPFLIMLLLILSFMAAVFFACTVRRVPLTKIFPNPGAAVGTLAFGTFFGLELAIFVAGCIKRLIPTDCPCCTRRRLVRHAYSDPVVGYAQGSPNYCQCGVCDADSFLTVAQYRQGCPNCGRHTLVRRRYWFYWCLHCKTRCKRRWHGAWEDASSAQDDRFYWLWSPGGCLWSLRDRITKWTRL